MSLYTDVRISLLASVTIPGGSLVKYVAGQQAGLAGTADTPIGVALFYTGKDSYASGSMVGVQLDKLPLCVIASGAITDGATVYQAANAKVSATATGTAIGIAIEAANDGDLLQIIRF